MGLKRSFLVALLCLGLTAGASGCGQEADLDTSQESTQQSSTSEEDSGNRDNYAQGGSILVPGSSASPVYSSDLVIDNGKDSYMAAVREKLELDPPKEYIEYEEAELQEGNQVMSVSRKAFLGMSVGGVFVKWFWRTEDDTMTGKQSIAAADVYGVKVEFDADAKPFTPDPDRTGMVVEVGGLAGRSGYVLRNFGYSAADPNGISIIGEEGKLLIYYDIPHGVGGADMMADKDFNLYMTDVDRICQVYNQEGEMILEDTSCSKKGDLTLTAFPDGTVGYLCSDISVKDQEAIKSGALYKIDLESKKSTLLAKRTENTYFLACFDQDTLLYADEKGIYKSDYDFQSTEAIYLWENHGLHVSDVERMSVEPDGSIDAVVSTSQNGLYYLHLVPTPEGIETMEIKFAVSEFNMPQYLEAVYRFNREHPACLITLEVYDEETKLLTELTAGKGPVLVDTDVVQFAANKKLWENLNDELAEWGLEGQLLEKPMLGGRIDGEQYGLVFSWDMYSFLTNCYEDENWDYETFLEYIKGNDKLKKIFSEQTPQNLMDLFFLRSLEDSYFVDAAENKAHFDAEEFTEVAELAKNLEVDDWSEDQADVIPKVRSGNYLGDIAYLDSPEQIAYYWEIYGENINFVGFPGKEGSCHFLRTAAPVAVRGSASEEEKQVAFWFLSEMLGKEAQRSLSRNYSVREDVFLEQLEEPKNRGGYTVGGETFTVTANWEAAKEKLLSLYEKSVPQPVMPEGMEIAISDELWECFYGTKSIEEVGKTLQNRVQLYLDEQK